MSLSVASHEIADPEPSAQPIERRAFGRRVLVDALFLGTLADGLLHEGLGLGLSLWMLAVAGIAVRLRVHRRFGREQLGWLVAALFFAGCFAWRDAADLLFYDFLAIACALLLFAATLSPASPISSILGQRVRDLARALATAIGQALTQLVPAFRESEIGSLRSWRAGRAGAVLRAGLIALPVLLVFALLFASADPVFGALLSLPKIDVAAIVSHTLLAAVFTWLAAGWLRGAFADGEAPKSPRSADSALTLGIPDITVVLGGMALLFGFFVGVQVSWLFGGERLVRSTTGLSYAEYARHGFFQLVVVSLLVLPVLLGTRAFVPDEDVRAVRRHRLLATLLLVLLGGVMASALGRMALYVRYYGLSTDRLYASVFMLWLAVVFVWFGLTILRGRIRDFAAGMAITGFLALATLNVVNPQALVARVNVSRGAAALEVSQALTTTTEVQSSRPWQERSPIDYWYLSQRLEGDAVGEVVPALLAPPIAPPNGAARPSEVRERCNAVRTLLNRWGPDASSKDWRVWDLGAQRARRAVRGNERQLRAVTCWDATGEVPFGTRERRPAAPGEQWYNKPSAS